MPTQENATATYVETLRLFSRDVRLFLICGALMGLCWMGIYGVLFNLYVLRLGYDLAFIGLINAATALAYALFSLPAGALGGRWSVRRTMVLGYGLVATGLALPPLAQFTPVAWRTGWLLVTYSFGVAGASLYMVNGSVFMMGATGQAERSHAFSVQTALSPLAAFFGSLIGGFLPGFYAALSDRSPDDAAPYGYALLTAAALLSLGIPVLLATRESVPLGTVQSAPASGNARRAPLFLVGALALVQLLQGAGEGAARTFFNVYLDTRLDVATHLIGMLAAIGQLAAVPMALATPLLIARWRNGPTFIKASLGIACSLLPMAVVQRVGAASLGYIGVMAMSSVWRPPFQVYRLEIISPRWRALMSGASNMSLGLSWAAMSLGGARIAENAGYGSVFLLGAMLTTSGALLFWLFDRVPRGEFTRSAAPDAL
jgi:predicted MFS family arabinose efflux permease